MAPRTVLVLAPLSLLVLPSASGAADPATHEITTLTAEPEAIDSAAQALEIRRAPRPANQPAITSDQRPQHLGAKILFVNFDGGQMNACGGNDPHDNCSYIFNGTVLPFSGDEGIRASVIQVVRKRVADFGITVTDTRPGAGDYDMEMVGNWQGSSPDFAGIAPAGDCWDNYGGETSFTLEVSTSPDAIAEIMLQELAHTWGLDHVDEQQDLLFPTTQGTNKTFRDECYQVVADTDLNPTQGGCDHHVDACGSYSQQNSYAELLLIFGESIPDTSAPAVGILEPGDGDVIEGAMFNLVIGLQDDQQPAVINTRITIESDSLPEPFVDDAAYASPSELTLPISNLPDGEYTITLEGQDESDNPAMSDSVTFTIQGSGVGEGDESGASADGSESGGDEEDDGTSADDDDGDDDDDDDDDDGSETDAGLEGGTGGTEKGCACNHGSGRAGALGLAMLGIVGLLGRRRRARA